MKSEEKVESQHMVDVQPTDHVNHNSPELLLDAAKSNDEIIEQAESILEKSH